jgi:hypothetical protein
MNSRELTTGNAKIARGARSRRNTNGIEFRAKLAGSDVLSNINPRAEHYPLGFELRQTKIEHRLLELELGYPVSNQSANALVLLEHNDIVSEPAQLLRRSQASGPGSNDCHTEAGGTPRRTRHNPALLKATIRNRLLNVPDSNRLVHQSKHARRLAGRRTEPAGELRKIVGSMERLERVVPFTPRNEIVPFGDDVPHGTASLTLTERDSTIHAARSLSANRRFWNGAIEFPPVAHPLLNSLSTRCRSAQRQKSFRITHDVPLAAYEILSHHA